MEQVSEMAVIAPGDATVQRQVVLDLKVIAKRGESTLRAEVEIGISRSDLDSIRHISRVSCPTRESPRSIEVRKELVRRALVGEVDTRFQRVAAAEVAPVILQLIGIHDASLRRVRCPPEPQQAGIAERNARNGVPNVRLVGNRVADRIPAELDVQTAIARTKFVRHT